MSLLDPGADVLADAVDVGVLLDRQTAVLELIAADAPLESVLTEILASLEMLMPGAACSVLLLDRDAGTLRHGAAPSLPAPYVAAIDGLVVGDGAGSCGTAAALNTAVVVPDVRTDPRWTAFRTVAAAARLVACWSTPIEGRDGLPVGTFAVYHRQPHGPTPREQRLVDRFRHLAAVAIDHAELQRDRQARLEAETARRTAEELSHAKSALLAAVGHEVRTPLQAIVGFAELLGTIDLDEARRREALGHIGAAAGHVMDLLTDVLDLSRLEAGALPLAVEPVDVREVVVEVMALLSTRAHARGVVLTHDIDDTPVLADRRRLRQVLLNLVHNAVRHGRPDGRVHLASAVEDAHVGVTVDDDGPGIPEELLPLLFHAFARATREHPAPAAGVGEAWYEESIGLGLGLARGLAQAMGGELAVGSTGPEGTSMVLRLPRAGTNTASPATPRA